MKTAKKVLLILMGLVFAWTTHAEIYRYVDDDGHVTLTNMRMGRDTNKNDESEQEPSVPRTKRVSNSKPIKTSLKPVDAARENDRKKILTQELAFQEESLAKANTQEDVARIKANIGSLQREMANN